ncbi:ABC transporter substrate-binding protein [Ruania alba]|uniref:Carbohydrate ABC transporter substrate-binding protein, CUT1 family n=1 Tax=Ruania alba TaxID=648782 RepID=A0A1H5L0N4_9MICO|nr:ABC transporter substrate-binding protein [Ruania alba]SEE69758.1 carbohydrate ABC transporter substrate-binding protein, CUT1 family [Ruania alba]
MNIRHRRRTVVTASALLATSLTLAACSGGEDTGSGSGSDADSGSGIGTDPDSFEVLTANENPTLRDQLDALAANQCSAENEALPLEHRTIAQGDTVQQITLLASQGALPSHFIAGTDQVRPDGDLGGQDLVLDYEAAFTESGAWENVLPAAASTIESVYGQMVSMPYQYNLEGFWYNKEILAELGLEEPQSYDELVDAADAAAEAGYIPIAQSGADGWPMTRLMGLYIFRNVGPDAMEQIRDGEASLTDPEYVAGAQALQDLALSGALGEGFISRTGDQATAALLSGQALMKYDGTWLLSAVNDPERNEVGEENIGFMPFPDVAGGAGSADQYPANAGAAMAINPETYGPLTADWFACIAENYGQQALSEAGVLSGFQVNGDVGDIPAATADIQERMASIDETVLWFEALLDSESNSLASTNASLLTNGDMSAEEYMTQLQDSIDSNR